MKEKLKKQRKKLIVRVTAILAAVWLAVSAAFVAITLQNAKGEYVNLITGHRDFVMHELSYASVTHMGVNRINDVLLSSEDFPADRNRSTQLAVIDVGTQKTVGDTSGKVGVKYGFQVDVETSDIIFGYLDQNRLWNAISADQRKEITDYLNTERDDDSYYELICTKFYYTTFYCEIIPKEVQVVLTNKDNTWFVEDEPVKTFQLHPNTVVRDFEADTYDMKDDELWECNQMTRNVIPKEFVFGEVGENIIATISEEQMIQAATEPMIRTGLFDYMYFSQELFYYYTYTFNEEAIDNPNVNVYTGSVNPYILQFAQRINLLSFCSVALMVGLSVIFLFFFIIATLLCVMLWKLMKAQLVQEQKRTDMTNALAHDLKTPLFVISGYAQSLRENINSDRRDDFAEKIIAQTEELNGLVHKMLSLGKLDSCGVKLRRENFDFAALAAEVCDKYEALPDGKIVTLTQTGDNSINADRELMKSALENLMDNAVKYSPPNSEIEAVVSGRQFSVTNSCEGLDKAELKTLWRPYERGDKSRSQDGNGLGLSIVKSIMDLHGFGYNATLNDSTVTFILNC